MGALHFKTKCKNYATVKKKEIFPHKMYIHTEKKFKSNIMTKVLRSSGAEHVNLITVCANHF